MENREAIAEAIRAKKAEQGRGRFGKELRGSIESYARRERAGGKATRAIARELGLDGWTLQMWLGPKGSKKKFRRVTVEAAKASGFFELEGPRSANSRADDRGCG